MLKIQNNADFLNRLLAKIADKIHTSKESSLLLDPVGFDCAYKVVVPALSKAVARYNSGTLVSGGAEIVATLQPSKTVAKGYSLRVALESDLDAMMDVAISNAILSSDDQVGVVLSSVELIGISGIVQEKALSELVVFDNAIQVRHTLNEEQTPLHNESIYAIEALLKADCLEVVDLMGHDRRASITVEVKNLTEIGTTQVITTLVPYNSDTNYEKEEA